MRSSAVSVSTCISCVVRLWVALRVRALTGSVSAAGPGREGPCLRKFHVSYHLQELLFVPVRAVAPPTALCFML